MKTQSQTGIRNCALRTKSAKEKKSPISRRAGGLTTTNTRPTLRPRRTEATVKQLAKLKGNNSRRCLMRTWTKSKPRLSNYSLIVPNTGKHENEDRIDLENEQMRERQRYEDNMKLLELCEVYRR